MSKIPFIQRPWYGSDAASIDSAATELINGMLEPKPGGNFLLRKRPGLSEVCNPGTNAVGQGCHYSEALDALFFVSNGKLWKYEENAVTVTLIGTGFSTTHTVMFAEGQNLDSSPIIYMADGGALRYTDGATLTTVADPSAPTTASQVVWFSNRFVANEDGTAFFYSTGVNPLSSEFDNTYWSGSWNPFVAEQKGDDILALRSFAGELWVGGEEGIEIWQDDGVTPLFTVPSALIETGIAAASSLTRIDFAVYGLVRLQGELMVCRFSGRNPTPISQAITYEINKLTDVSDAIGFHVFSKGASFYVITFPTEGITWAWDIKSEYWAQWGSWDAEAGVYDAYLGQFSAYASKWGVYLIQSRVDSRIYAISRDYRSDGGNTLRTSYTSPNFDHGTIRRKRCTEFRLHVRPTSEVDTGDHIVELRWKDNGRSEWSNTMFLQVDVQNQKEMYIGLKRLGIYRSRMYNVVLSDYTDLLIGDAEMELEKLRD